METVVNSVSQNSAENATIAVRLDIVQTNVQIRKRKKETVGLEEAEKDEKDLKESVESAASWDIKRRIAGMMRKMHQSGQEDGERPEKQE